MITGLLLYPGLLSAEEPPAGPGKQAAETTQTETESKQKSAAETGQAAPKPPQASDQETDAKEPEKSGVTETPPKPGSAEKKGKEDRRWITRIRPADAGKVSPPKDIPPLTWASEEQKKRCEGLLNPLNEYFTKARNDSVQGDYCSTAEHSKAFLSHVDSCKKDCPKEFLERNGYDETLIRALQLLYKSGTERCMGPQDQKKPVPKSDSQAPKD